MPHQEAPHHLTDTEIALMDAIKTLIDIMMAKEIVTNEVFDRMFASQRNTYIQNKMPSAAAVMELLRAFSTTRGNQRDLLQVQPKGSA